MHAHRKLSLQVTYNTLLGARRRYGSLREVRQCLSVYQEMRRAGYKANDYYLKELLEEWCEGILSGNQGQALTVQKTHKMGYSKTPHGLLLDKVAAHLQKDVDDNQIIDIKGLTKVEARIVVLSVLWKIRENYHRAQKLVADDMVITSGIRKEAADTSNDEVEVQLAIVKVLRGELGLDVFTGHSSAAQKIEPLNEHKHIARRPRDYGVVKVSRESLCNWLKKREGV